MTVNDHQGHSGDSAGPRSCCAPSRAGDFPEQAGGPVLVELTAPSAASTPELGANVVALPGGAFLMGTDGTEGFETDGEGPVREVTVRPFRISRHAVTNAEFARFVDATGYVTEAERFGWSYVFASFLPAALRRAGRRVEEAPWWCAVRGAYWNAPEGPGSDTAGREDHPVVHVSWFDADAYCRWAGGRLPTEAEWEYAARGGLEQARYPWGDELTPGGEHHCNIWQGHFPTKNLAEDGYRGTAPVDTYEPNGYGLYNVAGNVWEWCADWWSTAHGSGPLTDPAGPPTGSAKVIRGGSYLCHLSYCNRYRVAARTSNTPDSTTGHMGFRCAYDS
ncbi:formylglycine-generating enzyme family protein [Streptomyces ipomoeae]|uniref:formylglycine-generating enzyme family protein n=1 Tax=Streptomyces ipomoeae TaxID=103232 RepID=UPI0011464DB7|nr:formylglycine-generating enzyme family protein [Streptomyces ipomoeae]MDX2935526.1 formylglycine-generating enzyme family protein [Streptomyces ipomoeae]TQE18354.1 formylglycine-generating enzyme family protein [Streptomyces ipomoeae]